MLWGVSYRMTNGKFFPYNFYKQLTPIFFAMHKFTLLKFSFHLL